MLAVYTPKVHRCLVHIQDRRDNSRILLIPMQDNVPYVPGTSEFKFRDGFRDGSQEGNLKDVCLSPWPMNLKQPCIRHTTYSCPHSES